MKIIDGKKVANTIALKLQQEVSDLKLNNIYPKLAILCIQPDNRSLAYIKAKQVRAEQIGINTEVIELDNTNKTDIKRIIDQLNQDPRIHGIILQLPIPDKLDKQTIIDWIDPAKDVDGLTTISQNLLTEGKQKFVPATALGIIELLKAYKIDPNGKIATVIGRSQLVGKPVQYLLKQAGAEVYEVNRQTKNPKDFTKKADILVSAAGQPNLITEDMVKDGVVIIDVGITEKNQKLYGDVDFEKVKHKASFITPVPGGVGPMTVIMLLSNVVKATKLLSNQSRN